MILTVPGFRVSAFVSPEHILLTVARKLKSSMMTRC